MSIQDVIKKQVHENRIVLYMKGTPDFPQCGFSANAVGILRACGANELYTVNVLENPDIRQGIKDYANWPTIPQLYVNGEFVGGSDILTELYKSGELKKLLEVRGPLLIHARRAAAVQFSHTLRATGHAIQGKRE